MMGLVKSWRLTSSTTGCNHYNADECICHCKWWQCGSDAAYYQTT